MLHPFTAHSPASRPPDQSTGGFFLIELLVAVALIGVLVGLVLPGMQQLLRVHQVRTVARDLSAEIFWAQAEAARRGSALVLRLKNVSECRSAPAGTPLRCGWDVFMDLNQDGLQQAGEMIVHSYENPADLTIRPANGDAIFIDPTGMLRNTGGAGGAIGASFLVEAIRARPGDPASRRVCINAGNRVRIAAGAECRS